MTPSIVYPNGDPMCPNNGFNGYRKQWPGPCPQDDWGKAAVAAVVGGSMSSMFKDFDNIQQPTWGYGVFYGVDSNSADKRCRWLQSLNGYDCPGYWLDAKGNPRADNTKFGAGNYDQGNPQGSGGGGGAGCHFDHNAQSFDQFDASQTNLVQDLDCQCNYALKDSGWEKWVQQWIMYGKPKAPAFSWEGWFKGGTTKAPSWALDLAACWVNNPRDMIYIQNMVWFYRFHWSNQLMPKSNWDVNKPESNRYYWGWNEVPVQSVHVNSPSYWDAVAIKLPAAICPGSNPPGGADSIHCLSTSAQADLEKQLDWYVKNKFLKVGAQFMAKRPGSYVVLLREYQKSAAQTGHWQRWFFCENWNANQYQVVFKPQSGKFNGECYLDKGVPPAPPPPCGANVKRGKFMNARDQTKCLDIGLSQAGQVYNGAPVQLWDCNGMTQQNWKWCNDGRIVSAANENMCLDIPGGLGPGGKFPTTDMQMWTCNGGDGQKWKYGGGKTIYPNKVGETMCLDLENGSLKAGTRANLYYCSSQKRDGEGWIAQNDFSRVHPVNTSTVQAITV